MPKKFYSGIQLPEGAAGGSVLTSDASGIAAWKSILPLEAALASDFTMTSPATTRLIQGSFVADSTVVKVVANANGDMFDNRAAYAALSFFYGTAAQPVWRDTQGVLRSNTSTIDLGGIGATPGTHHREFYLTGLTVGTTYNWALTIGIVGYMTTVTLPEACSFISCSKSKTNAGALLDTYEDRIIVAASTTLMHIVRSNHLSNIKDELLSGAGIPFSSGHGNGIPAISPDGTRILVPHFSLSKASLYDLTDPAQPIVAVPDFAIMANALASVWAPDGSACWIADFAAATPHVQKITGLLGSNPNPVVATSVQLDTIGASPQRITITPDGSKLLVGHGTTTAVYIVNTSTNAVTKVLTPGSVATNGIAAINNNEAIVSYGTNSFAILNLTTQTWSGTFTDAGGAGLLAAFGDGLTSIAMRGAAGTNAIGHINHPINSGNSALNMYTHWPTGGTPKDIWIDDFGNIIVVNNTPNQLAIWYGGLARINPSGSGIAVGHHATVQILNAH